MVRHEAPQGNAKSYRRRSQPARRPATGECGTLGQQFLAINIYLDAQADERRTGAAAERLWQVCHALATEQPIPMTYAGGGK